MIEFYKSKDLRVSFYLFRKANSNLSFALTEKEVQIFIWEDLEEYLQKIETPEILLTSSFILLRNITRSLLNSAQDFDIFYKTISNNPYPQDIQRLFEK